MTWVVFDYGEVLCTRTEALPGLAARLDVSPERFESAYWAHRDAYDRGCTDEEYWSAVAASAGATLDATAVDDLTRGDVEGWSHLDPASAQLLDDLARDGARLALLSNAPTSFARFAERQPWAQHFRVRVFSADVGCAKPDPKIFRLLTDRLGAEPGDCVFFDDRAVNVTAAQDAGLHAHLWQGADHARRVLFAS
ncbi:haloacid dehalogenase superfamily protein, subfamily IA, variant 3 with third motif having DD or ED [Saccharomonospora azurea SZMC 14600]|uniref:HAD family hydrolase n=1 Tax=Saccharomonospora azurea TaxID=40988 RepID=UPI0002400F12|nr:HAD family phosphatase [Saccharomonospora azurea]EHK89070.1 haloacid dehalogenase superfamily protein, subfamily IA, variant 3 with third motif having DD or ED [Saccharomonospora azurea SZMC 14600]